MQSVGNQSVQRKSVGVRELRNQVAAVVRRAGGGERIIVTVDGEPVAQLGPLEPTGAPTIDDLAAAGLVRLPGRPDRPSAPRPFGVPVDARPASVIAELRGETG
jgi:prevent-host-death family protein